MQSSISDVFSGASELSSHTVYYQSGHGGYWPQQRNRGKVPCRLCLIPVAVHIRFVSLKKPPAVRQSPDRALLYNADQIVHAHSLPFPAPLFQEVVSRSCLGLQRSFHIIEADAEDVTPTKRAASCGVEDLNCLEATIFDKPLEACTSTDVEAESQLLASHAGQSGQAAYTAQLADQIRVGRVSEAETRADPDYMERHGPLTQAQHFLEPTMRTVTVSWLVEVACEFSLQQETLFIAVDLLDRFLSKAKAVPRGHLQLTAVACQMIAAKMEQETHPAASDFTNIADHCFQVADLLRMESLVLQTLDFRVTRPNAHTMLGLFRKGLDLGSRDAAFAMYIVELSIVEYGMLQFPSSVIAAAAILLVQAKNEDLEAVIQVCLVSGHHPARLVQCSEELGRLQERAFYARDVMDPLTPVKEKYGERSWYCVSVVEKPVDRGCVVHAIAAASHSPAVQALGNHTREEVHRVLKFR